MTNSDRLSTLVERVDSAEERLKALEVRYNDPINRVKRALLARGVYSAKFATVQPNYYDLTLDQRAELLGCSVPQLCKSIIFENTMHDPSVEDSRTNSKYYCVITQYTGKSSMLLPTRVCVLRALAFSTCSVVVC
jgi:hypothetical protein